MEKKLIWLPISLAIIIIILAGALFFIKKPEAKVTSVKARQEINSPLVVEGKAKGSWFFEGSLQIKILDENGNVLGSSYGQAQGDWMTEDFVAFKGTIAYESKTGGKGFLVVANDNPSGLAEYNKEIKIPIVLAPTGYTKIKVYFNNNNLDFEISCNKVFASEREILKTEAIGSAAINELLEGPTSDEINQGFYTNINSGVKLQGLSIDENGIAHADFDKQLEQGIGGSCKISAIRAQIVETLKQFSTIKDVVISIDGRTEDILQP